MLQGTAPDFRSHNHHCSPDSSKEPRLVSSLPESYGVKPGRNLVLTPHLIAGETEVSEVKTQAI